MTREEQQIRRSKILHEMRKRFLENASSFLDERVKEIELLQDGPLMFKTVRMLQRRLHSKLTVPVHDEFKHVIADKHKVWSIVAKHFDNQFQDGGEHGVDMFEGS